MKIKVYYVVRIYTDDHARIDSGPHKDYIDARLTKEENHRWDHDKYDIMETFIEGNIL